MPQVTACKTSQDAIQVLKAQQGPGGAANFDLILKEHCPSSGTNAARFLRRAQTEPLLQGIPVIGEHLRHCRSKTLVFVFLGPLAASQHSLHSFLGFLSFAAQHLDIAAQNLILEPFLAVASATEDRDVMVNCLQLGAADFMLKPLRASELRNLWARVYWWRRVSQMLPPSS